MRILCAPDKFKESLTAAEAAAAMARGIARVLPDARVDLCPIADGGDGTVDAILAVTDAEARTSVVPGPLGDPVRARWALLGADRVAGREHPIAVIEMAAASGLALLPPAARNPLHTTTFGTGKLIEAALHAGARTILLGIGGSATNDGGCGLAQALGVKFYDRSGYLFSETHPFTGGMLDRIGRIDLADVDPRLAQATVTVACDVGNPLTGPNGAAAVYGPQKGANPEQVARLDANLGHLARLIREQLGCEVEHRPGAGAAGGLGAGLIAFFGASLRPGIELVLDIVGFDRRIAGCDLCLTGEGRLDGQSLAGKAVLGVAAAARRHGVDTIALVGSLGEQAERTLEAGLSSYHLIGPGLRASESIERAAELLEARTEEVVRKLCQRYRRGEGLP